MPIREDTNSTPSAIANTPATTVASVEPDRRRVMSMIARTTSTPATADMKRQPSGV